MATPFNTLRPRQNGCHFPDDIFKCIFWNKNAYILVEISLKLVHQGTINNIPALVQIMAWRRPGDWVTQIGVVDKRAFAILRSRWFSVQQLSLMAKLFHGSWEVVYYTLYLARTLNTRENDCNINNILHQTVVTLLKYHSTDDIHRYIRSYFQGYNDHSLSLGHVITVHCRVSLRPMRIDDSFLRNTRRLLDSSSGT